MPSTVLEAGILWGERPGSSCPGTKVIVEKAHNEWSNSNIMSCPGVVRL